MTNIWLLARITFKECIRNRALHAVFLLAALMFAANLFIAGTFSWEPDKVAVDVGLSVVSLSGLFLIFFLAITMLANDLERKTLYLVLARPFTRGQYILGKYAGLCLALLLSSVILGACAALSVLVATYGCAFGLSANFAWGTFLFALIFLVLSLLVVLALAFFWASVTTHPFTAMLLSLFSYFIGHNIETVRKMVIGVKVFADNVVLAKTVDVASWIFPNLAAFDMKTTAAHGLPLNCGYLVWVGLYGLSYIAVLLFLTILVFRRRELA